jgi:hypothetical protein
MRPFKTLSFRRPFYIGVNNVIIIGNISNNLSKYFSGKNIVGFRKGINCKCLLLTISPQIK